MIYTFVNPHDDYTFDAPDDDVANCLVLLLGSLYGWERDGRTAIPGLAGPDTAEGEALLGEARAVIAGRRPELVAALRTLEIKAEQRARLGVDPEKWHDEMRSSMSDPRAHARQIAAKLEATPVPDPVDAP